MKRPSADQSVGWDASISKMRSSDPETFASFRYSTSRRSPFLDLNATYFPSGDHTGILAVGVQCEPYRYIPLEIEQPNAGASLWKSSRHRQHGAVGRQCRIVGARKDNRADPSAATVHPDELRIGHRKNPVRQDTRRRGRKRRVCGRLLSDMLRRRL